MQDLVLSALEMEPGGMTRAQIAELAGINHAELKSLSKALYRLSKDGRVLKSDDSPARYFPILENDAQVDAMIREAYRDVPKPMQSEAKTEVKEIVKEVVVFDPAVMDSLKTLIAMAEDTSEGIEEIRKAIKPIPADIRDEWIGVLTELAALTNDDIRAKLNTIKTYLKETL